MMNKYIYIFATILLVSTMSLNAQVERKYIRSGNELYGEALSDSLNVDSLIMQKSEVEYRKAIEKKPSSFEGRNNLANSLYRQKKYDEALNEWESLTSLNIDAKKKAALYHNIGNAQLMSSKLKESIEAYKNALRNYPNDTATKYNLAFAQSKLNQQEQQQQQNKDNQEQNKDQQDQEQNKDQQNQDQQNQEQQQNKEQEQNKEQQSQEQQKQQEQQAQEQEGKEGKEGEKGEEISKQDAMRILQALEKDEKDLQQELKRKRNKNTKSKKTDKDW